MHTLSFKKEIQIILINKKRKKIVLLIIRPQTFKNFLRSLVSLVLHNVKKEEMALVSCIFPTGTKQKILLQKAPTHFLTKHFYRKN